MYVEVLRELAQTTDDAFATFEIVDGPKLWFQVANPKLAVANAVWLAGAEPLEGTLTRLGIEPPPNLEVVAEDTFGVDRVITFHCAPMNPREWATFIDAVFRGVHNSLPDYRVRGWVTQW